MISGLSVHSRRAVPTRRSVIAFACGGLWGCAYHVDAGSGEDGVEGSRELGVAVTEGELEPVATFVEVHQ
nr:hypothetical protein [Parafrankia sp. Ea1.12]